MLVHVDTESWQSEINLITLLSETKKGLKETEKLRICFEMLRKIS